MSIISSYMAKIVHRTLLVTTEKLAIAAWELHQETTSFLQVCFNQLNCQFLG